jgi:hypothetical protein
MTPRQIATFRSAGGYGSTTGRASLGWAAALAVLLGCSYGATFREGVIGCGDQDACPAPLHCILPARVCCADQNCTANGVVDGDAGVADGQPPPPPPPTTPDAANLTPGLTSCTRDGECATGHCVGGICCDQSCDRGCESCLLPGKVGKCSVVPVGTACGPAPACDATSNFVPARACNGTEVTCPAAAPVSCGGYICASTGCKTSCVVASDCAPTHYCFQQKCAPKLADGMTCATDQQCAIGACKIYFADTDGDGFGDDQRPGQQLCGIAPPAGFVSRTGDCCDKDARAKPGQLTFFDTRNPCGSWDWDCSKVDEPRWPLLVRCTYTGANDGWVTRVAVCGELWNWSAENRPGVCASSTKTQQCH